MAKFAEAGVIFKAKDFDKFISSFGKANSAMERFNRMIDRSVSKLGAWEAALRRVGTFVTRGFVAALTAGAIAIGAISTSGVGLAASFEDSFADVTKTVDVFIDRIATAEKGVITLTEAGESFRSGLVSLSNRIPVTFEELSRIAGLGGQLGVINNLAGPEAEDALLRFTETVAGLAEATNLTQEIAGTGLAQISNVYRESIDDIGMNIERLGSALVELGNTSATTESKILNFTSRIAGASQTIGITQAEMLGIATAFSSIGLTAEAGSTAVNRAFLIMNEAINQSSEQFLDNTASIDKVATKLSNLNAKLVRLEAQSGLTGRSMVDQRDAFLEAGGAVEDFGRMLGDARREQLFRTQDEIDKLTQKLQVLRLTQGQALSTEVFDEFLRVINQVRVGTELTGDEFRKLFRDDPAEAFTLFIEGLALEGNRAGEVLEKLGLNSVEAQRAFLAIAGASDSVRESILRASDSFEANAALAEEVSTRYATLVSRLDTFRNITRNTSAVLFSDMIPSLIAIVDEAGEVVEVFGVKLPQTFKILKDKTIPEIKRAFGDIELPNFDVSTQINFAFDTLNLRLQATDFTPLGDKLIAFRDGPLATAQAGLVLFRENTDLVTAALGALAKFAAGAVIFTALTKLAGLLVAITSPLGIMLAAVIALGIAWEENFMGMRDMTTSMVGSISPHIDDLKEKVLELWSIFNAPPGFEGSLLTGEVIDTPSGIIGVLNTLVQKDVTSSLDSFTASINQLNASSPLLEKALGFIERLIEQINIFFVTLDVPDESFNNFIDSLAMIGVTGENLIGFWDRILDIQPGVILADFVNFFTGTSLDMLAAFIRSLEGITRLLEGVARLDLSKMSEGFTVWFNNMAEALGTPLRALGQTSFFQNLVAPIGQSFADWITQIIDTAITNMKSVDTSKWHDSISEWMLSILSPIWDDIRLWAAQAGINSFFDFSQIEILPPSLAPLGVQVVTAAEQVKTTFNQILTLVNLGLPDFGKLIDRAKEVANNIKNTFTNILGLIKMPDFGLDNIFGEEPEIATFDQTELDAVVGTMADDVISGLESEKSGLQTAWEEWFVDPIESGIQKGKDALGIDSDSKVMIEIGENTIGGFITGLRSGEEEFLTWMQNLTNVTVIGFQGLASNITTTTMPALDAIDVKFGTFYQETLPTTTSAIVDGLIPAKIQLTDTNELFLTPSVERLMQAEEDFADSLTGNVLSAINQIITTKDRLTQDTKDLMDQVDKLTESYELLADAIKSAVSAGSGSISPPGTAASPAEFQEGGSFIVPPSVGSKGMPIIVHPNELVQITPANLVKNVVSVPDIPLRSSQQMKAMPVTNMSTSNVNSGNTTTSNSKEFHLHVSQPVGPKIQDDFELMEALS